MLYCLDKLLGPTDIIKNIVDVLYALFYFNVLDLITYMYKRVSVSLFVGPLVLYTVLGPICKSSRCP